MKRAILLPLLFLLLLPLTRSNADRVVLTHGPVVGAVTSSQAKVFLRTGGSARVQIRYGKDSTLAKPNDTPSISVGSDTDFTAQVTLTALEPLTLYYLDILVDGVPQLGDPYPHFETFPPEGQKHRFKFVILTDFMGPRHKKSPIFDNASATNPAFVIIGGDFGHGNPGGGPNCVPPPERDNEATAREEKRTLFRGLYTPRRKGKDFVNLILQKYPVAHMWDDHDYGANDCDKTYKYKEISLEVLKEYFPLYPVSEYGDWQRFTYAQGEFFLLDSRSQRDPNRDPHGPQKSMLDGDDLGEEGQWVWLTSGLRNSTATWKFILTPSVFNRTTRKLKRGKGDSWHSFDWERRRLLRFIRENHIRGVIFISGDIHAGAIDDGTNSGLPEMVVPAANEPRCQTARTIGKWSEGYYGSGILMGPPCLGYGLVEVLTDPDRVVLEVMNAEGKSQLRYVIRDP